MFDLLIVDAGATKTGWRALTADGEELGQCSEEGINAVVCSSEDMIRIFGDAAFQLPDAAPGARIYYYGAGCATSRICYKVADALRHIWNDSRPEVNSDLLGAARSLLGRKRGIACILGTGSNACLCDNGKMLSHINSLGFILGDEGSGAALGKRLLSDYFKGYVPVDIADDFKKSVGLNLNEVLENVYRKPAPNRFLASMAPFLRKNLSSPYVKGIVLKEFTDFFRHNVAQFDGARHLPICFTGSIAHHFSSVLKEAADALGFSVAKITKDPLDDLVRYHIKN